MMDVSERSSIDLEADMLLRLRHVARHHRAARAQRIAALAGAVTARRRGRGTEINDIRAWLEGDDVRYIDRNVTARTGVPHVRTFRDDRDRTSLLLADFRPSMLFGTKRTFLSVAAAEALALTGWSMIAEGRRVGLFAVGLGEPVFVLPRTGEPAMAAVIGALVQAHARALESRETENAPLDVALGQAAQRLPPGGTLVVATSLDDPGEAFAPVVRSLARRLSMRIILVTDAFERERRRGFYPFVARNGRTEWGRIEGNSKSTTQDARLQLLTDLGVDAVRLDAELDPEAIVSTLGNG